MGRLKKGFTLIEVMVALLVISLMMTAFLKATTVRASAFFYLENKMLAQWVAEDVASQIQTGNIKLPVLLSTVSGDMKMLNKNFQWSADFQATENKKALKTNIKVFLNKKTDLANYVAFLTPSQT